MTATLLVTRHDPYVRDVTVDWDRDMDGDTFGCFVDLGWDLTLKQLCRLAGLNAPDKGEPGRDEAKAMLAQLLKQGPITVQSVHRDKFGGRFDAQVLVDATWPQEKLNVPPRAPGPIIVNDELVQLGYAVPWDGRGPRPIVPWPREPQPAAVALASWHPAA